MQLSALSRFAANTKCNPQEVLRIFLVDEDLDEGNFYESEPKMRGVGED